MEEAMRMKFRRRKNESESAFFTRIRCDYFIDEEKSILDFFRQHPRDEPDGSFIEATFRLGWGKALRYAKKHQEAQ
jgi:hypothetical protein